MGIKKYLVNTNSKKIHLSNSTDGRCKIKEMRDEYKNYFDTLEEALAYPSSEKPLAKKCSFCLKNNWLFVHIYERDYYE